MIKIISFRHYCVIISLYPTMNYEYTCKSMIQSKIPPSIPIKTSMHSAGNVPPPNKHH
uniref:Uncharacterized protein n=1 Tax=Arundo donax TaxID=35708 RepID=A0A0A9HLC8_ARUDO